MKKTYLFLFVLMFIFSFSIACNKKTDDDKNKEDEVTVEMTESYKTNRENFKKVTGVTLPAVEKLEVDEYPYKDGDTSYCFDIVSGDNLNYSTYEIFEKFFKDKFGDYDDGYPTGDEDFGRDAQWTVEGRWYQTYWDKTNKAIYINTTLKEPTPEPKDNMTASYKRGRQVIYNSIGIWIPELDNVELLASSDISRYDCICFDIPGDKVLFQSMYDFIKEIMHTKSNFALDGEGYNEEETGAYWEYITNINNKKAKVNVSIIFDDEDPTSPAIYINVERRFYYNVSIVSTNAGSFTIEQGSTKLNLSNLSIVSGAFLTLTATPNEGFEFEAWYIDTYYVSPENPYLYEMPSKDIIIEARYEEAIVEEMTESYKMGRDVFKLATGIDLPVVSDLDADIAFGDGYVMFDLIGGENLTKDTYDDFIYFLDVVVDWTGEDATQSEYYPTKTYTNNNTGASFQVVWNGESSEGGIYLNVMVALDSFKPYESAKLYLTKKLDITVPDLSDVSTDFSCSSDNACFTFDLYKETNFTEDDFNQFASILTDKLGTGHDVSSEIEKRIDWKLFGQWYSLTWDLTTGIAINFDATNAIE